MCKINRLFFEDIFNPLIGAADIDEELEVYKNIDLYDIFDVNKIINEVLKPYFVKQNSEYKYNLKQSLAYYLTTFSFSLEDIIDTNLLPFNPPKDNGIFFFKCLWDSYFGDEDYNIKNVSEIKEVFDLEEFNRVVGNVTR